MPPPVPCRPGPCTLTPAPPPPPTLQVFVHIYAGHPQFKVLLQCLCEVRRAEGVGGGGERQEGRLKG